MPAPRPQPHPLFDPPPAPFWNGPPAAANDPHPYPDPPAPASHPHPPKLVTVVLTHGDPNAIAGLNPADSEAIRDLSVRAGASALWRLVEGARAAGWAVLIRSDLPPID